LYVSRQRSRICADMGIRWGRFLRPGLLRRKTQAGSPAPWRLGTRRRHPGRHHQSSLEADSRARCGALVLRTAPRAVRFDGRPARNKREERRRAASRKACLNSCHRWPGVPRSNRTTRRTDIMGCDGMMLITRGRGKRAGHRITRRYPWPIGGDVAPARAHAIGPGGPANALVWFGRVIRNE